MSKEFRQTVWDESLRADWAAILQLAIQEDLGAQGDCTTNALVDENAIGGASVIARRSGIVAGLPFVAMTLAAVDPRLDWLPALEDGQPVGQGSCAGVIRGPVRGMLSAERIVLNLICRLSGIATLTGKYVEAVAGTKAKIYDTRKTTPGWRRLEKYAVRCGGGQNHRGGLFEAVLIKDNHLAWGAARLGATGVPAASQAATQPSPPAPLPKGEGSTHHYTPAEAVRIAKSQVRDPSKIVEVEVDTLDQLQEVLPANPDIVLLDNMLPAKLREAVEIRNCLNSAVELEASGGINLQTIRAVAESGVQRISVGALTHSAVALDFGLDWRATL